MKNMNTNYYQVVEQTKDEKVAMYMKLTKRELIEMVIHCNELLGKMSDTNNRKYRTGTPYDLNRARRK